MNDGKGPVPKSELVYPDDEWDVIRKVTDCRKNTYGALQRIQFSGLLLSALKGRLFRLEE